MHELGTESGMLRYKLLQFRCISFRKESENNMYEHLHASSSTAKVRCIVHAAYTDTYYTFKAYSTIYSND